MNKQKSSSRGNRKQSRPEPIHSLVGIMARLRAPDGCPWDREQDHMTLRWHAVEEVYELIDAIEAKDDHELEEELGDLLLQVVFHCQLAAERGAFSFDDVARHISDKLLRRHPHVFGETKVKTVDQVWSNWEKIKREEKSGTAHERGSSLDGVPKHLPALLRAEKLLKKAERADLETSPPPMRQLKRAEVGRELFDLVRYAHAKGWSAEDLLRTESLRREREWRKRERNATSAPRASEPAARKLKTALD